MFRRKWEVVFICDHFETQIGRFRLHSSAEDLVNWAWVNLIPGRQNLVIRKIK